MASWRDKGAGTSTTGTGGGSSGGWRSRAPKAQVGTGLDFATATGEAPYTAKLDENKKAAAQQILRLEQSGFFNNELRGKVQEIFRPEELPLYGLEGLDLEQKKSNFQKAMQLGNSATGGALFKGLSAVDRGRATVAALAKQGGIAWEELVNTPGHENMSVSWKDMKADIDKHIGFGDVYTEFNRNRAEAQGGRSKVFGLDALGVNVDAEGKTQYNSALGRGVAVGVGAGGDIAGDPLSYVGGASAATRATQKALTRAGYGATVKKIGVHGMDDALKKGLITEAEHQGMREVIRQQASDLVDHAIEGGHKRKLTRSGRARQAMAESGDVEGLASYTEGLLERQGRAGLKLGVGDAKRTVLPTYVGGTPVLTTRKYGANIMGKGGQAAAEAVSEAPVGPSAVDALRGAETVAETPGLKTPLTTAQRLSENVPEVRALLDGATPGVPTRIPAELSGTGQDLFVVADTSKLSGAKKFKAVLAIDPETNKVISLFADEALRGKGVSQKLYQAAEDAGYDIAKLGTDDFTEAGKAARLKFLESKAVKSADEFGTTWRGPTPPAKDVDIFKAAEPKAKLAPHLFEKVEVVRETPLGALRKSKVGQGVGKAFAKRSAIRAKHGEAVAEEVYREQVKAGAFLGQDTHDMALQMGKTSTKAIKLLEGGVPDGFVKALPELEGKTGRDAFNELYTAVAEGRLSVADVRHLDVATHGKPGALTAAATAVESRATKGGTHAATGALSARGTVTGEALSKNADNPAAAASASYHSKYGEDLGLERPRGVPSDTIASPSRGEDMAKWYDEAAEVDEAARPAYEKMVTEVEQQYKHMTEDLGIKVDFTDADPYPTHQAMIDDVVNNKHLSVFKTPDDAHPFMTPDQNDMFRAVHDFFGHAAQGNSFARNGEEIAWMIHSQMFTPEARRAMTTETRLQNSFLNFSEQSVKARQAGEAVQFGPQKAVLAPQEWVDLPTEPQRSRVAARILTDEGAKAFEGDANLALREALGIDADEVLKPGTDLTEKAVKFLNSKEGIRSLNNALVEKVGLAPGTKLFHEDIVASIALRSRESMQAAVTTNMYRNLAEQMIDRDTPILTIAKPGDKAAKAEAAAKGWVPLGGKQPSVGDIYGPKEVMEELRKVQDIVINDESLATVRRFLDGWNATWAGYATNPLPFGFAFHTRNAIGNVMLAFLGGLKNPAMFGEAANYQRGLHSARQLMIDEGIDFEEALVKAKIKPRMAQNLREMRAHGVISSGFFADLDNFDIDKLTGNPVKGKSWLLNKDTGTTRTKRLLKATQDNKLLQTNRKIGDAVENNARIALFLDAFNKSGSVEEAASTVKRYLFDYTDLTDFERRNMKALNRFYTFTRKNTAVQLYALAHNPWRQSALVRAESGLYGKDDQDGAPLPDYAKRGGFAVSRILGTPKGTDGVAMNIDTPLDSAIKTLDPIAQAVTMVPGIRNLVPPEYRSDTQKLTTSLLNQRAGGPQELINFMFESAQERDTFSGKDLSDEKSHETLSRFANAFIPLWGKTERGLQGTPVAQNKTPGMDLRLQALQTFVGINVLPMTDKQRNQIAYQAREEAQSAIDKLKAAGIDIPSYTELMRLGLVPDLTKLEDKPATERRTSAEVTKAAQTKLNATRALNGLPPVEAPPAKSSSKKGWRASA